MDSFLHGILSSAVGESMTPGGILLHEILAVFGRIDLQHNIIESSFSCVEGIVVP